MTYRSAAVLPRTDWSLAVRGRARVGHGIEVHETISSTNDRARELLDEPGGDGGVVLAEVQTAGRGRRGRDWLSPAGVNLTLSVALRPMIAAADAWRLGLAAALATRDACAELVPAGQIGLKWPNDVVDGEGRKVAGLLVETVVSGERLAGAVIGIGINVNWTVAEMPGEIAARARSLADLAGEEIDRVVLLDRLLDALDAEVRAVERGDSPLARYRVACVTLGEEVDVDTAAGDVRGRAVEIDETGSLVLETDSGRVALATGEVVSVRSSAP